MDEPKVVEELLGIIKEKDARITYLTDLLLHNSGAAPRDEKVLVPAPPDSNIISTRGRQRWQEVQARLETLDRRRKFADAAHDAGMQLEQEAEQSCQLSLLDNTD